MSSSRPYMIRAIYDWVQDNQCTPYLLVNASADNVQVPRHYVQDGQIVLNISSTAVANLHIDNEAVSFSGRFGGVAQDIFVPVEAVMAIYARENGQGMLFETDENGDPPPGGSGGDSSNETGAEPSGKRPSLKVVK